MAIKLGIIGYRNHAAKLLSILENKPGVTINTIYHPDKKIGGITLLFKKQ